MHIITDPLCVSFVEPADAPQTKVVIPFPEESENITRWIVDQKFRDELQRLKIPLGEQLNCRQFPTRDASSNFRCLVLRK